MPNTSFNGQIVSDEIAMLHSVINQYKVDNVKLKVEVEQLKVISTSHFNTMLECSEEADDLLNQVTDSLLNKKYEKLKVKHMDEIGGLQYEIKSLRSFADGTALENKNIKASNKKVHEDNEKLKAQQKSAKIMNETLDELIKEKIDELQEENSKLKAEVSNFKKGESWLKLSLKEAREEIYEKDPETGENTDVKSLDIQSQKLSDIYEIFEDETKGYCLYHGECGFKDFLCILQKSRDNAEKYEYGHDSE